MCPRTRCVCRMSMHSVNVAMRKHSVNAPPDQVCTVLALSIAWLWTVWGVPWKLVPVG